MTIPLKMKTMMYKNRRKSPAPLYLVLKFHSSVFCFIFLTLLILHLALSGSPGKSFVNTSCWHLLHLSLFFQCFLLPFNSMLSYKLCKHFFFMVDPLIQLCIKKQKNWILKHEFINKMNFQQKNFPITNKNSITGRYAKVFIFFPYLPVFNLFAILYSLILNFLLNRKTPETLRFRGILRLDTMYLAVLYLYN